MNWRSSSLIVAALLIAACNDPLTSPKQNQVPKPEIKNNSGILIKGIKVNSIYEDTGGTGSNEPYPSTTADEASVPQYSITNDTPRQYCANNLASYGYTYTSAQKQGLIWDDWSILQQNPVRQYSGVLLTGRFQITFKGFDSFYSGQRIQCVRVTSVRYDKERNYPRQWFQEADPTTEFWVGPQSDNFGFCFGSACSTEGANLHVQVKAIFRRKCYIDNYVYTCSQDLQNGQIAWDLPASSMTSGQWDVQVFASGFWTVWNYGGNPISGSNDGQDLGFYRWSTSGYNVLGSYWSSSTPGYAANAAGYVYWKLY